MKEKFYERRWTQITEKKHIPKAITIAIRLYSTSKYRKVDEKEEEENDKNESNIKFYCVTAHNLVRHNKENQEKKKHVEKISEQEREKY